MDPDRARQLLQRERGRVERELADLREKWGGDELSNVDQHNADAGTELFGAELDESMAERVEQELAAIERAEKRLKAGSYGVSVDSGKPIPDARLEAIPYAERTADEQGRYEGGQGS